MNSSEIITILKDVPNFKRYNEEFNILYHNNEYLLVRETFHFMDDLDKLGEYGTELIIKSLATALAGSGGGTLSKDLTEQLIKLLP